MADLASLDKALRDAILTGWPIWRSPGTGGKLPNRREHHFAFHKLQQGARIDFYRGTVANDLANVCWSDMLRRLPTYAKYLAQHPECTNSKGNAMEMAAGISFAAATGGKFPGLDRCQAARNVVASMVAIPGVRSWP